jgi:D-alanyl-D-alanine carboxypeptidase
MMNSRARQLGLSDTHYVRPDGLDAYGQLSSARDVTRLARLLMRRPLIRSIVRRQRAAISRGRVLHTWNDLLATFPGVFGVKTGHTSVAGWNEVAALSRGGVTVYGTILGAPDRTTRNRDLAALLRWALTRYRRTPVIGRSHVYARVETGYGHAPLRLVARSALVLPIRIDEPLVQRLTAVAIVALPVRKGEGLGELRVYQGARLLGRRELVAERNAPRPGLLGRVGFYSRRMLDHIWGWLS